MDFKHSIYLFNEDIKNNKFFIKFLINIFTELTSKKIKINIYDIENLAYQHYTTVAETVRTSDNIDNLIGLIIKNYNEDQIFNIIIMKENRLHSNYECSYYNNNLILKINVNKININSNHALTRSQILNTEIKKINNHLNNISKYTQSSEIDDHILLSCILLIYDIYIKFSNLYLLTINLVSLDNYNMFTQPECDGIKLIHKYPEYKLVLPGKTYITKNQYITLHTSTGRSSNTRRFTKSSFKEFKTSGAADNFHAITSDPDYTGLPDDYFELRNNTSAHGYNRSNDNYQTSALPPFEEPSSQKPLEAQSAPSELSSPKPLEAPAPSELSSPKPMTAMTSLPLEAPAPSTQFTRIRKKKTPAPLDYLKK